MKIRIKGDTLRLRLTQTEIQTLAETGLVKDAICFAPNNSLNYCLKVADVAHLQAQYLQHSIAVLMPHTMAQQFTTTNLVSCQHLDPSNNKNGLQLLVEKDFQCLQIRPNEDDSDAYPNPLNQSSF